MRAILQHRLPGPLICCMADKLSGSSASARDSAMIRPVAEDMKVWLAANYDQAAGGGNLPLAEAR